MHFPVPLLRLDTHHDLCCPSNRYTKESNKLGNILNIDFCSQLHLSQKGNHDRY